MANRAGTYLSNLSEEIEYNGTGSFEPIDQVFYHHKSIKDLFEEYDGEYTPKEFDWGIPAGEEWW